MEVGRWEIFEVLKPTWSRLPLEEGEFEIGILRFTEDIPVATDAVVHVAEIAAR